MIALEIGAAQVWMRQTEMDENQAEGFSQANLYSLRGLEGQTTLYSLDGEEGKPSCTVQSSDEHSMLDKGGC